MTLTLVTAWYTIKSKFDKRQYQIWMKNFLTNNVIKKLESEKIF